MSSYDSPANVARYSGVQGSPNSRRKQQMRQNRRGQAILPEHVPGVRQVLIAHGYQVDKTGPLTDRLLSAWRNYRRTIKYGTGRGRGTGDNAQPGAHTVKEWNQINPRKYGKSSGALHTIATSPPAKTDFVAKANNRSKTHGKAEVHAKSLGVKTKQTKSSGMPGVGNPSLGGNVNVNKLLPSSYAETVAAAQFDPQIAEARRALAGQQRDEAQAQRDISSWYGQVEGSQKQAASADASAGSRARADVANMIQAITGSLGGSRGAGLVAAQGANNLTALAAQGQNQDKYNAELAPILATAQADAASRQRALASQADVKSQGAIQDLLSSRGLTKAKALGDVTQMNNQSRQQNFANRQALFNASLAAQSLGLDAAKTQAQLASYGLDAQIKRAGLKAAKQKATNHPNWEALDPVARENYANHAVSTAIKQLYGDQPSAIDPDAVANSARAILRTYGFGSARGRGYKGRVPSRQAQTHILGALNTAITTAAGKYNQ